MHISRKPPETAVKKLLAAAQLPTADITPELMEHFFGAWAGENLEGVVGLEPFGPAALLRSLAVVAPRRRSGLGSELLSGIEQYAMTAGVRFLYLLTTTAEAYFRKRGYFPIPRVAAPEAIRNTREFAAICPASSVLMVKPMPAEMLRRVPQPMAALIEFDTERLCLRQWCAADRAPFAALNADPRVMAFFAAPLERAASDALADRCQTLIAERGWGLWAVETQERREFIGLVGLHTPSPDLPFSPCVEIGWRLAYRYWGQGYAFEAARAALRVGFELLALPEIVAFTAVGNRRSRTLMERLGMRAAAESFDHPHLPVGSALREHSLYRLACTEWRTPRAE